MGSITTETVTRPPDIDYKPDFEKFQARTKLRLQNEDLKNVRLPIGFPQRLESDFVWEGDDLAEKYDWTYVLTEADVEELEDALTGFKC